jgi:8-oxo-dGTP pyrophosphatase MutT (NUDIX family)
MPEAPASGLFHFGANGDLSGNLYNSMVSSLSAKLYWIISRAAHAFYERFPILGSLRGSIAIIRRGDAFLVIERNDGYGLAFPGGLASFREPPENTIHREVAEETGLTVSAAEYLFDFRLARPMPTHTYVYEVTASGQTKPSWEGVPREVTLTELQQRVVVQQRQVVDYLLSRVGSISR